MAGPLRGGGVNGRAIKEKKRPLTRGDSWGFDHIQGYSLKSTETFKKAGI